MSKSFNISRSGSSASGGANYNVPKGILSSSKVPAIVKNTLTNVARSNKKISLLTRPTIRRITAVENLEDLLAATFFDYTLDFNIQ